MAQKYKELDIERRLWKNREVDWNPGDSTDLHRIEVFDGVISDKSRLRSATLCSREEFQHVLERVLAYATTSGDMPLFRDDESWVSDPGNRCRLRLRHALLMSLMHKKDNPTQGTLQAIFGIDQTSVCRISTQDRPDHLGLSCHPISRLLIPSHDKPERVPKGCHFILSALCGGRRQIHPCLCRHQTAPPTSYPSSEFCFLQVWL